ncbi:hypothetical protein VA7868_00957 [Vibrio aerogenes CECT 7868]|uniref:Protein nucleotidyltransferase YdiU n=1 Tax=Vibrio aerogenes CECT 7868 TaxID=1216006 RepID=A0A1M5X3F3_9VIBR|nr:YdiU family protein [Vibrio aerogenes]SHH94367.1 hypothetical protein VA7868_00957 [Vibrio aerogenes CECT 7868]
MSFWQQLKISHRYAQFPPSFYTKIQPEPLEQCRWGSWNTSLARSLGLPETPDDTLLDAFSGADIPPQFDPLAMKYAGHQFGVYNPDLGDGRGLLLGEITDQQGRCFDIHIKGSGRTPYSRMGDGRAVLRSTIREYLCSEAIHALGGPTTRALGLITSDSPVFRERAETGAMLIRLTETHIRFGHFEHFFYTGQLSELRLLADKVIAWHFPQVSDHENAYLGMFEQIIAKTAEMIAFWQAYGFAHGVMNTDNMSVLGQTFDYGPFSFLDDYDPHFICNHSDYQGRYAFDMQPGIGLWNLTALAHALTPLVDKAALEQALDQYEALLNQAYSRLIRRRLGLYGQLEDDSELCHDILGLLAAEKIDYTVFFRHLSSLDISSSDTVTGLFSDQLAITSWLTNYLRRCEMNAEDTGSIISAASRCEQMRQVNPKFILRTYLAQQVIDAAEQGDFSAFHQLAEVLKSPFDEHAEFEDYAKPPPDWGKGMVLTCSS